MQPGVRPASLHPGLEGKTGWMLVRVKEGVEILTDKEHLLYGFYTLIEEELHNSDAASYHEGRILVTAFPEVRPVFDLFLTQVAIAFFDT